MEAMVWLVDSSFASCLRGVVRKSRLLKLAVLACFSFLQHSLDGCSNRRRGCS